MSIDCDLINYIIVNFKANHFYVFFLEI